MDRRHCPDVLVGILAVASLALGLIIFFAGCDTALEVLPPAKVVQGKLKVEEGFRAMPYRDSRGTLTIGYGTNLDIGITRHEGALLLYERVAGAEVHLVRAWPRYEDMPYNVQVELLDMAYQLGVSELLGFHDMLMALARGNYETAALEALNSAWARETESRAAEVAAVFRRQLE